MPIDYGNNDLPGGTYGRDTPRELPRVYRNSARRQLMDVQIQLGKAVNYLARDDFENASANLMSVNNMMQKVAKTLGASTSLAGLKYYQLAWDLGAAANMYSQRLRRPGTLDKRTAIQRVQRLLNAINVFMGKINLYG